MNKFVDEIETRRDELYDEHGYDEASEVKINQILRDEFNDDDYSEALIELGINDDDLGLEEDKGSDDFFNTGNDDKTKDKLLQILLDPSKHIYETELRLKGWEKVNGKYQKKSSFLIPTEDITYVIQFLEALYLPQHLASKLHKNVSYFDDTMNILINNFRIRISNYPDSVVSASSMRKAIDIILNEVNVVRSAIVNGRLGDIARDMIINSFNEKSETTKDNDLIQKYAKDLGMKS